MSDLTYELALLDRWLNGLIGGDRDYEARLVQVIVGRWAEGTDIGWCETHEAKGYEQWPDGKVQCHEQAACRIVERRLCE